jgi:hypothetical protein
MTTTIITKTTTTKRILIFLFIVGLGVTALTTTVDSFFETSFDRVSRKIQNNELLSQGELKDLVSNCAQNLPGWCELLSKVLDKGEYFLNDPNLQMSFWSLYFGWRNFPLADIKLTKEQKEILRKILNNVCTDIEGGRIRNPPLTRIEDNKGVWVPFDACQLLEVIRWD